MKQLTVVVTRYGESDDLALECLQKLSEQTKCAIDILFLDQKDSDPLRHQCERLANDYVALKYMTIEPKSLSFARNFGITAASTNFVAFCDLDAFADNNWASAIIACFEKTHCAIVGTRVTPGWRNRPRWYHQSKYIQEFYSMLDISQNEIEVAKIVGASFALDKALLGSEAYFDEKLGRAGGNLLGGEETDLCIRAIRSGHKIMYTPAARVVHQVFPERMELKWLLKRAYFGGYSRARSGGAVQAFNKEPLTPRDYAAIALVIPAYGMGYIAARTGK